jgi:hypothetical protein
MARVDHVLDEAPVQLSVVAEAILGEKELQASSALKEVFLGESVWYVVLLPMLPDLVDRQLLGLVELLNTVLVSLYDANHLVSQVMVDFMVQAVDELLERIRTVCTGVEVLSPLLGALICMQCLRLL